MEKEANHKLPYLDIHIDNSNVNLEAQKTTVYRKKTFEGIFTNFLSFSPKACRVGLIKTLIDRL